MQIKKYLIGSVAATALATSSFAGGLSPEIMEAPVAMEDEMVAPAASSISPLWIVGGLLAGALIWSMLEEEDNNGNNEIDSRPPPELLNSEAM